MTSLRSSPSSAVNFLIVPEAFRYLVKPSLKSKGFVMLVLSRRADESIEIGDQITITVVQVAGDKVRLGITAPRDVRVLRSELAAIISKDGAVSVSEAHSDV